LDYRRYSACHVGAWTSTAYTLYGFIHILLVLAIVVVLIRVIQGRRPVL